MFAMLKRSSLSKQKWKQKSFVTNDLAYQRKSKFKSFFLQTLKLFLAKIKTKNVCDKPSSLSKQKQYKKVL